MGVRCPRAGPEAAPCWYKGGESCGDQGKVAGCSLEGSPHPPGVDLPEPRCGQVFEPPTTPAFQETLGRPTHPSILAQETAASGSRCLGLFALLQPGAAIYFFKTSPRSTPCNLFRAAEDSSRRMFL